jgi:O-antigen/teichoic acid export membrane protein
LGGSVIQRGIAFMILPIFTHYLAPDDFGILSLLTTFFVFTSPIISLGALNAISVAYFNEQKSEYPSYFSSSLFVPFLITVFLFLFSILFGGFFSTLFGVPKLWLLVIPIFSFLSFISQCLLVDYQIKQEPVKYGVFSICSSVLNIALSIFLVAVVGMDYQGRLIGQYFSIFIFATIALIILKQRGLLIKKISKKFIKDSLLFGLPIVPHVIGGVVINMSDKIFINQFLGTSELGIYNIGYVIGATISMLSTSFASSIVPISYELFAKGDKQSKEKVVKIYWLYIFALLSIVALLSITAPYIFDWFINKQYKEGARYVKWISLGYFFHGCYLLFANTIYYTKKTKILLYWSVVNIIVNLGLNYLLIPIFGSIGAAYTLCISYFIFSLSMGIISNKIYPLPWLYFIYKKVI